MKESTGTTGVKGGRVRGFFGRIGGFIKRHKVLTVILVILLAVAIFIIYTVNSMRKAVANLTQTPQVVTLEKMNLEQIVAGDGTVQSATARQVGTALTSKITHVYVDEGDYVNAGDELCQLDTTDIDKSIADAKKEIAKAQASDRINLQAAQRRLDEAIAQYSIDETSHNRKVQEAADAITQARVNAGVAAGNAAREAAAQQAAASYQPAVDAAAANLAAAETRLSIETSVLATRQSEVDAINAGADPASFGYGSIDDAILARDTAQSTVTLTTDEIENEVTGLRHVYNDLKATYDRVYSETIASSQGLYDAKYNEAYNNANVSVQQSAYDLAVETRASVLRADNTTIATCRESLATQKLVDTAAAQKTQLEKYEKEKEESTITAPVSGTIVEISAEVGLSPSSAMAAGTTATAGATSSLFTIKDEGSLEILVPVPEYDAVSLSLGMPVTITSDAISGQEWQGIVANISPAATDEKSNFSVTIQVTTAVEKLAIGMSAKVNIITDAQNDVFAVPYDAVTTDAAGQSVVYAYEPAAPQGQSVGLGEPAAAQGQPAAAEGMAMAAPQGRPIVVETGMETDYYIQISGEGLTEGLTLLADPEGKNVDTANNFGMMFGPGGGF